MFVGRPDVRFADSDGVHRTPAIGESGRHPREPVKPLWSASSEGRTVSLIFLDTPQIDLLERVRRSDRLRYSSFRDTWKRRGCTLVLTLAQEGELGRYSNDARREARYQVLADLAPIRRDVPTEYRPSEPRTLMDREILRAMVERALITVTGPGADELLKRWTDVLPGHLNANEAGLLRLNENETLRGLLNLEYDAARFSAAADRDAPTKTNKRVRDVPSAPTSTEKTLDYRTEIEKVIALLQEQSRLGKLPPIPVDALPVISNFSQEFLRRAEEIGPQAALVEYLPVVGFTKAEQLKLTTHELASRWFFESQVRSVARELLNASEQEQELLARTLDFADCPGSWLQWNLGVCVRRGCSEPRPNHHFDEERLGYLPYVDLLLTDAEMVEFVRQVRNDKSTPARIRDTRPPVAIPTSLDALEEALDSLEPRTSG